MDDVSAIKARIPIEELVGSYCTLQKKGRNFVCLCPFHNDSRPSFLVSPDKGIAYCFACQTGGDIFSFYQSIEGVDFPQALKELAERAGVTLQKSAAPTVKKDDKERARACLQAALSFFRAQLSGNASAMAYLESRKVTPEQREQFEIGYAPDSFSATYDHLLKANSAKSDIVASGLGVQRDLQDQRVYDRFRNRLMFPIHDAQGMLVGFGGRTLGNDDAKYVNSSEGILFHKSSILYGFHRAKESMREKKNVILVEGYFDVLACHQVGVNNVVATCGTALTAEHVKVLRRYVDRVTLCLDQDRAGRAAMERAFPLLAREQIHVDAIVLPGKDPADALVSDAPKLKLLLETAATPYLDVVIGQIGEMDLSSPVVKREALQKFLSLLSSLPSAVERSDYLRKASAVLQTTEGALEQDMRRVSVAPAVPRPTPAAAKDEHEFSACEIALGMFLHYPKLRHLLEELIAPQEGMAAALYAAIKAAPDAVKLDPAELDLPHDQKERAGILYLFCEYHGFTEWSESLAVREIRKNCQSSNKEFLRAKQFEITKKLVDARRAGQKAEEAQLLTQYEQLIRLMKKAV